MTDDPHSSMSKEPFSEKELRKIRHHIQFLDDNEIILRRGVTTFKSWWLLPLGVVLAVSGALGKFIEIITNKAGL